MVKCKYKMKCSVLGCTNASISGDGITYHHLPREYKKREQWIKACNITNIGVKTRICSSHFQEDDYFPSSYNYIDHKKRLKKTAIPSIQACTPKGPSLINGLLIKPTNKKDHFIPNILKRSFAKKSVTKAISSESEKNEKTIIEKSVEGTVTTVSECAGQCVQSAG